MHTDPTLFISLACEGKEVLEGAFESGTSIGPSTFLVGDKTYSFDIDSIGKSWDNLLDVLIDNCNYENTCKITVELEKDQNKEYDGVIKLVYDLNGNDINNLNNNKNVSSSNGYGPKILGLQLGMPVEDGAKIINQLCAKVDMKAVQNPERTEYYGCSTPNNLIPIAWIAPSDDGVSTIVLSYLVFGYKFDEEFIQMFVNKYNIPSITAETNKYGITSYIYKDVSSGWQVKIELSKSFPELTLTKINKLDSSIFD